MGYCNGVFHFSGFFLQQIIILVNRANVLWCMEIILDITVDGGNTDLRTQPHASPSAQIFAQSYKMYEFYFTKLLNTFAVSQSTLLSKSLQDASPKCL